MRPAPAGAASPWHVPAPPRSHAVHSGLACVMVNRSWRAVPAPGGAGKRRGGRGPGGRTSGAARGAGGSGAGRGASLRQARARHATPDQPGTDCQGRVCAACRWQGGARPPSPGAPSPLPPPGEHSASGGQARRGAPAAPPPVFLLCLPFSLFPSRGGRIGPWTPASPAKVRPGLVHRPMHGARRYGRRARRRTCAPSSLPALSSL